MSDLHHTSSKTQAILGFGAAGLAICMATYLASVYHSKDNEEEKQDASDGNRLKETSESPYKNCSTNDGHNLYKKSNLDLPIRKRLKKVTKQEDNNISTNTDTSQES